MRSGKYKEDNVMDLSKLEAYLEELFVKKVPALPDGVKKFIVEYIPYLSLFGGLMSFLSAYWLWQWAHAVNYLTVYYGIPATSTSRMSIWVWISVGVSITQAILYLRAYSPLKDRKKAGWNLLFYVSLLYIAYAFVGIFITNYGGFGNFIGSLIGTAVSLYFLFQIRGKYLGRSSKAASQSSTEKPADTTKE